MAATEKDASALTRRNVHRRPPRPATGTGLRQRFTQLMDPTDDGPGMYQPERVDVRQRVVVSALGRPATASDLSRIHSPAPTSPEASRPTSPVSRPLSAMSCDTSLSMAERFRRRPESSSCRDVWKLPFAVQARLRSGPPNAFALASESAVSRDTFLTQRMTKTHLSMHRSLHEMQMSATRPLTYLPPESQVSGSFNAYVRQSQLLKPKG